MRGQLPLPISLGLLLFCLLTLYIIVTTSHRQHPAPSPTFPDTTMARVLQERDSLAARTQALEVAVREIQEAAALYAQEAMVAEGKLSQLQAWCENRVVAW